MSADTADELDEELPPHKRLAIIFIICALVLFIIVITRSEPTVTVTRWDPATAERQRKEWQRHQDAHLRKVILQALREHDRRG